MAAVPQVAVIVESFAKAQLQQDAHSLSPDRLSCASYILIDQRPVGGRER